MKEDTPAGDLRAAESQAAILNAIPAHIALLDPQGVILVVNESWKRFATANVLQSPAFGVGCNYLEVCEHATGDCSTEAAEAGRGLRRVLRGEAPEFSLEYPCHSLTEQRWFRLMVTPISTERRAGAVVMHINITERKMSELAITRAAQAVQDNQQRMSFALEAADIADWSLDLITNVAHRSLRHDQCFGYTEAVPVWGYDTFLAHIQPVDRERVDACFKKAMAGIGEYDVEFRTTWPDSSVHWLWTKGCFYFDEKGTPCRVAGIVSDITERRRMADAMAELTERTARRERMLSTALAAMSDFAQIYDRDGRLLFVNQPLLNLWGLTLEQVVGKNFSDLNYPAALAEKLQRQLREVFATAQRLTDQTAYVSPNGQAGYYEYIFSPVMDADGTVAFVVGTTRDITEHKRTEMEIFRTNRALQMLSSCNEKLVRVQNELVLLQEICRIAVEQGGYRMAWVGYAQKDEGQSITPVAHAGLEDGYLAEIKVSWRENEPYGQGPAGQVIRSGEAVLYEDFTTHTDFGPWQKAAQQRGYRGVICLPLCEAAHTFGLLTLYTGVPTEISAEELKLLKELADDLAFGILNLRARDERRRAQEALRTSEAEFRLLSEAMPQIVWITRPDGWNIYFNQRWMDYTGLTLEESLGHGWNKPFHPDDQQRAWDAWQQATATGGIYSVECRLRRADGAYQWWLIRGVPQLGPTREILKWFGTCTDIDESKRAQVRISEQAALIDEARDAIIVRDLDHRITFWSRGAERLYRWTAGEAVGRTIMELIKPEAEKFHEAIKILLREGAWSGEIKKDAKTGVTMTLDARWTLLRDAAGQPKSILAIDTDITERKKLEQQFLRAQRMESIGTLAGGIAHDLNNLLSPITMGVDLLKLFETNPKSLPVIENIERSAKRGANLVKQVLSFARGVEGARVPLQVRHVLLEVESIATNTFPKHITVESQLSADLWPVLADPTQLNQIVLNLAVNARDAMPNGGRLELKAENVEIDTQYALMNRGMAAGRYVKIQVTDSGCGIPREIIDRIFEPFFTTKELGQGTGLGLSTVQGIVRSHGGVVNVYSEPDKGSTFAVYLPAHEDGGPAQSNGPAEETLPRGQGELVLVVDDETSILEITKQTLIAFGYRVVTADDGAHAISIYAQQGDKIAVVLTDMMMPVMDGPALIAALRRINPQVRVICASGLNDKLNAIRAVGAPAQHFLPKPYSADALLTALRAVLRNGGSRPPR